jgi:hypothetical protein
MIKPSSPDLSGVFAVGFRKQANGAAFSRQRAALGLEDEDSEDISASTDNQGASDEAAPRAQSHSQVSFFA